MALRRCSNAGDKRGFLYSLLSLLAVLSRELAPGEDGSFLVAATPRAMDESWRSAMNKPLQNPVVCRAQDNGSFDCGLSDFMSGGTPRQALTDIAGAVVGGGGQL